MVKMLAKNGGTSYLEALKAQMSNKIWLLLHVRYQPTGCPSSSCYFNGQDARQK